MINYKTSEWVSLGHPDKMADYVSEYILDRLIEIDPETRYALECQIKGDEINLAGEITTKADVVDGDFQHWAKEAIREIGYVMPYKHKFGKENTICGDDMCVHINVSKQSPDIAQGVDDKGWGDQGIFFGYYCGETPEGQGYEYHLAKEIGKKIYQKALSPTSSLGLDVKTQVTISIDDNRDPERVVEEVIVAVPMVPGQERTGKKEVKEILNDFQEIAGVKAIINGTGTFHQHGPVADSGTTGRKLVVDFYGGRSRIGGGSPWTKDGTKADLTLNLLAYEIAREYFNEMVAINAPIHHTETELSCCIGRKEVLMQITAFDEYGNPFHRSNEMKTIKHGELIKRYKLNKPVFALLCREGLFSTIQTKKKGKAQ